MAEDRRVLLGKKIKKYRLRARLTQGDLSIMVGHSSPAFIAYIEHGHRNINAIDLSVLAKKLGVSTDELLKN